MVTGSEKLVISFFLAVVLILNISIPVIYAIERAEDKTEPMQVEENIEESKEKPESEGILDELLGNEK